MAIEARQLRTGEPVFGAISPGERKGLLAASSAVPLIGLVFIAVQSYGGRAEAVFRGESDWSGRWLYRVPHEAAPDVIRSMDLELIHRDLLPQWVAAAARAERRPGAEREASDALRTALRPDPNLSWIIQEIRQIVVEGDPVLEAERLQYLCWLWSRYLDEAGQPLWLQGAVGISPRGEGYFYLACYRTEEDLEVEIGGAPRRVRVVSRVDQLNLRDRSLGRVSRFEDGAVIILERLEEFALDSVWPLLGGGPPEDADPLEVAFTAAVIGEANEGLPAEVFERLAATAADRAALRAAVTSIGERQWCSGFSLRRIPVEGFSDERLTRFAWISVLGEGGFCPRIKLEEAEALVKHSEALRSEEGDLGESAEALVAWLARTVSVHEGRHVADEAGGGVAELDCAECGPPSVRAEVSAYLASFAWSPAPATAMYQACRAVQRNENPHAAAMEAILQRLGGLCEAGPSITLQARARQVEATLLGRAEAIRLPADFPTRVNLPEHSEGRARPLVTAAR